ncbi:MAG: DNA-3-methyladenine glycosylase [Clostridiales bacterium 38-18]|nr:MAG: DNA-3-methyladenine glycosylase [Clostridiales bacterium 38-18]
MTKVRCAWLNLDNPLYVDYHDEEWGVPVHEDAKLFEMLILEGAQAGLSWETILKKRENYRNAFDGFDVEKISGYDDIKIEALLQNEGIVRNRLKVKSTVKNAQVFIAIQKEYGSFDKYLWQFVNNEPILNYFTSLSEVPAKTSLSDLISKDLKKRGMSFVGSTIIYAYLQAVGVVNDHTIDCFKRK